MSYSRGSRYRSKRRYLSYWRAVRRVRSRHSHPEVALRNIAGDTSLSGRSRPPEDRLQINETSTVVRGLGFGRTRRRFGSQSGRPGREQSQRSFHPPPPPHRHLTPRISAPGPLRTFCSCSVGLGFHPLPEQPQLEQLLDTTID